MHYETGKHAAEKGIDVLIGIGALSGETARGAEETAAHTGKPTTVLHFNTKQDFFAAAESVLKDGDTILVKASHGMEFPEIVEWLKQRSNT